MNKIPLVNIGNKKRTIYLFSRNEKANLCIRKDTSFYPFYYEPDSFGDYVGYDGKKLRKVIVSNPDDIPKLRSPKSYSSDIKFTTNYIVERIDEILPSKYKYLFLDIEILANEIPDKNEAKYPISCITVWNNYSRKYKNWFLGDFPNEEIMLEDFVLYLQEIKADLWLSWNVNFDYNYLFRRIPNFAKRISPVNLVRRGNEDKIFYPVGMSILDYLTLFKKVFMREASYALDYIGETHLGKGKTYKKVDFGNLSEEIRYRNIEDVEMMVKLEEKYQLLPYYDEIRRLAMCNWEDLVYNSRIAEMLFLKEAKNMNIVLPNKKENEGMDLQGAIRNSLVTGDYYGIGKFDLNSAYPSVIYNFCLDSYNIVKKKDKDAVNINGIYFKQDQNAIMPRVVKKMLTLKNNIKKELKNNSELKNKYAGIKGIVNSLFGVTANKYFRLFNKKIASSITFLVRNLIEYTIRRLKEEGYEVVYYDTDAVMVNTEENITNKLNRYILDWAKEYGKESIDLQYEYEGCFSKVFFLGSCHYYGYLKGQEKPEIKGVEIKRVSSSKYESYFQKELLERILNKEKVDNIIKWILEEKERIKTLPLVEISFPFKLQNKKYKNKPIFVKAMENIENLYAIDKRPGIILYYIFVENYGYNKKGEVIDVIAFDENMYEKINRNKINWEEVVRRNIINKARSIFEAKGWNMISILESGQKMLWN